MTPDTAALRQSGTLADVGYTLSAIDRPADRIRSALERLRELVPYDCCGLLAAEYERVETVIVPAGSPLDVEIGQILRQQMTYLTDVEPETRRVPSELGQSSRWTSHLSVPLVGQERVTGLIMVVRLADDPLDEGDLAVLSVVAGKLAGFLALAAIRESELDVLRHEQDARRAADEASRAKDRLMSIVSHELRQPLNIILGWARHLQTSPADAATVGRAAAVIERNAALQGKLIDDLFDLTRASIGRLTLARQRTDLAQIVAMAADAIAPAASAKRVAVSTAIPGAPAMVDGDPVRLNQIVTNLLTNAVKFTKAGGRIRVGLDASASDVRITIADTGIGIDADFLPLAFEEFQQARTGQGSAPAGIGLGLTIAKHLVELHDGRIEANSEGVDRGATFIVTLPRIPE